MVHFGKKIAFVLVLWAVLGFMSAECSLAIEESDFETIAVVATMKKMFNLKDAQVNSIIPVFREYFKHIHELKSDISSGTSGVSQTKIKYLRDDLDANLKHYLTAQQMDLWKQQFPNDNWQNDVKLESGPQKPESSTPAMPKERDGVLESNTTHKIKSSGIW